MILIQRYTFKELVYNFIFSFVVISSVVLLAALLKALFQNPMLGLGMAFALVPFMLLGIMQIVFPAAALVSVVTTYGRMAADNEILALKASGVHFFRIVVPAVFFGLVVSLLLLVADDRFVPMAEMKLKELSLQQNLLPLLDNILKRGLTNLTFDDWTVTWDGCERTDAPEEGGGIVWTFKGFTARRFDARRKVEQKFYAETAVVSAPDPSGRRIEFRLRNGREIGGSQARFGEMVIPYRMSDEAFTVRLGHRSLAALLAMLHRKRKAYDDTDVLTEIHGRIAQSLSPFVMVFLGLSVAVIFRYRNRMIAFFISLLIAVFVYYPVMLLGQTFAEKGVLHPAFCIWPGNVIMFLGGLLLLFMVTK